MLGLVIRILVLCSVVFAIAYAITRVVRMRLQNKEIARIADEIARIADETEKLRKMAQHGTVTPSDYAVIARRIREDCQRLGVEVPDLPSELPPQRPKD